MAHRTAADSAATASLSEALADFFRATRRARGRAASQTPVDGISLAQFHVLEPLEVVASRADARVSEAGVRAGIGLQAVGAVFHGWGAALSFR